MSDKPLAIDLFCGLGGWTEGLLAEGYHVIGFDIEQHVYGEMKYPTQLVVQDVLTLHGSQFEDAALIVASPPCQEYSYMAMPWKIAKAKAAAIRADETGQALERLNRLFNACFRIQREACEASGRHIPMVVENVKGAQPWVGRSRWNFGSFYLWGDLPALMPRPSKRVGIKNGGDWFGSGEDCSMQRRYSGSAKTAGGSWFAIGSPGQKVTGNNPADGRKMPGIKLSEVGFNVAMARTIGYVPPIKQTADMKRQHIGTKRKMASALIAKIPLPLSRHIAQVYRP